MFKTILSNLHLEKIFWIIKSKLKFMILGALIMAILAGAAGYFRQSATYVATISFYVYSSPDYVTDTDVNLDSSELTSAKSLLSSYMQIISSNSFMQKVLDSAEVEGKYTVKMLQGRIGAEAVENTAVFKVSVYDENPVNAMNIANTIGELAPNEIISVVKSGGIEVLDKAELPTAPFAATSVLKYAVLGGGAGFIILLCVFMFKGLNDTTVRRKYEIEDLFTIPILGEVPSITPSKKGGSVSVNLDNDSPFAIKEAYSNIRANLLFTTKGDKCPVYAVTSADTHEGKTLNSLNTAVSYAKMGKRVLFIDGDMRKSHLRNRLDMKSEKGLSEYLACITEEVNIINYKENFDLILSGDVPPNPAELLVGDRWYKLIADSKEKYDVIFVDLPPLGVVSDALCLAKDATAYILLVREWVTKFDRVEMIVRKLESLDANICGIIYNGISVKSPDYNYRNYGREYDS